MAFLDNSGDILLDAVLTDAGRQRMARGEFKITKFSLGDEEINYELFNKDHVSGSAFYDLEIMQTPILEAFTNNTSTMKSRLMTITRNNILHLPILKINTKSALQEENAQPTAFPGGYILTANLTAETTSSNALANVDGVLYGVNPSNSKSLIVVDQGIDSDGDPSYTQPIDDDFQENQYLIQVDHRLLRVTEPQRSSVQSYSFVDDDNIATYYFSIGKNATMIESLGVIPDGDPQNKAATIDFKGPLGTRLKFKLSAALNIRESTALFDKLGPGTSSFQVGTITNMQYLDTIIRVTGVTTGYSIDIPIRIVRKA